MQSKLFSLLLAVLICGAPLWPARVGGPGAQAVAGTITGYTLVDADFNLPIVDLAPGMVLDLSLLPTRNLNIRADTDLTPVGSVVFDLTGPQTQAQTDNDAPFALFGDVQGDYLPWVPPVGSFTLRATPYDGPNGTGSDGASLTLSFSIIDSAPLPVVLTAFTAEAQGPGAVLLRWSTASEENNREFVVQRSSDGRTFTALGSVAGHGTSAGHDYRYEDRQLPALVTALYYRLQQVDSDGTATFSPVRRVTVEPEGVALRVFLPTASTGLLHYTFSGAIAGTETLELYTILGQHYGHYRMPSNGTGTVPLAGLPPGVYLLRLATGTGFYTNRFVLP